MHHLSKKKKDYDSTYFLSQTLLDLIDSNDFINNNNNNNKIAKPPKNKCNCGASQNFINTIKNKINNEKTSLSWGELISISLLSCSKCKNQIIQAPRFFFAGILSNISSRKERGRNITIYKFN